MRLWPRRHSVWHGNILLGYVSREAWRELTNLEASLLLLLADYENERFDIDELRRRLALHRESVRLSHRSLA